MELSLAIASVVAAFVSAGGLIYDIRRRNHTFSVKRVFVPNQNGGYEIYRTMEVQGKNINAKKIIIKADNSVVVTKMDNTESSYASFYRWDNEE